jgi:YbgC/YbaW family acyl-CoA thioester hydrolase
MPISEYRLRRRVQFHETDGAGIVHFSWFFRYMEEAEHALWRSAGLNKKSLEGISFPRVAAGFDYKRPLRFEDEFEALMQIIAMRTKSMAYSCVLTLENETVAAGTMTIVCASVAPGQPLRAVPFPQAILDRLEAVPAVPRP